MPIDRKSEQEFEDDLRTAILNNTTEYDTAFGPVKDIVIRPVATIAADINNERIRPISLLTSLTNASEFSEDDLDALVANEDIERPNGSFASTTLTFQRRTPFDSGEQGTIPRGTPIGTAIEDSSGEPITFVTSETKDKTDAVASIDTTTNTVVYKVRVPAVAVSEGTIGRIGPNRINRPLRPLSGYTSVTNEAATQNGSDRLTNEELVELYLLAVASRQLSVPQGAEFYTRQAFPDVDDVYEVGGTSAFLTRGADDAGAVDMFVKGQELSTQTDTLLYLGVGQLLKITLPPMVSVESVESGATTYEEDVDYVVVFDDSGVSGSVRAVDGIRFLSSATNTLPSVGDTVSITYQYNSLIRSLQEDTEDDAVAVDGRDLLYRQGDSVDCYMTFELRVKSGFTATTIRDFVRTKITNFVNESLGEGDDVEFSDLDREVRLLTAVDNFRATRMSRSASDTSASDIQIDPNEYPHIDDVNLVINLVS